MRSRWTASRSSSDSSAPPYNESTVKPDVFLQRILTPEPPPEPTPKSRDVAVPPEAESVPEILRRACELRIEIASTKYGTPLQCHTNRSAVIDLAQELVDATNYASQVIMEARDHAAIGEEMYAMNALHHIGQAFRMLEAINTLRGVDGSGGEE